MRFHNPCPRSVRISGLHSGRTLRTHIVKFLTIRAVCDVAPDLSMPNVRIRTKFIGPWGGQPPGRLVASQIRLISSAQNGSGGPVRTRMRTRMRTRGPPHNLAFGASPTAESTPGGRPKIGPQGYYPASRTLYYSAPGYSWRSAGDRICGGRAPGRQKTGKLGDRGQEQSDEQRWASAWRAARAARTYCVVPSQSLWLTGARPAAESTGRPG
jgi:hypothetical protein